MNWSFEATAPLRRMTLVNLTLEGDARVWVKKFAAEHGIATSHAVRSLISEAVKYWLKHHQSLERRVPYCFAEFEGRGQPTKTVTVKLPQDVHEGLRRISETVGKSVSHVASEMLLDAKKADLRMKEGHRNFLPAA